MVEHCHVMVAQVAKEMAQATFEEVMRDNVVWEVWRKRYPQFSRRQIKREYIKLLWPKLIPQARSTLQDMLASNVSAVLKDQIYDALLKDATLGR